MLSRVKRFGSTGKGLVITYPSVGYPAAGTVISTACGSQSGYIGTDTITDALGTQYTGSFTYWQEVANGFGGSTWNVGGYDQNPCYFPYGFVRSGWVNNTPVHWYANNGSDGYYNWGEQWDVYYSDGNGGTLHDFGLFEYNGTGYVLSTADANGTVVYISVGSYAFWYNYGYYLGNGSQDVYANVGCGDFYIHTAHWDVYANGMGGEYWVYTMQDNPSYETLLHNCNDYNYRADGNGSYYQAESTGGGCPPYGTVIGGGGGNYTVNFGCGDIDVGSYSYTEYADGNCSSFTQGGNNYYYSYGQLIQECNCYNYYSDGGSSYYQGEYTCGGAGCDPYGTWISGAQLGQNYIDVGCGDWSFGTYDYDVYADGNCSTYNVINYYNYLQSGTYLGNCNGNNYYSNGSGSYYTEGDGSGGGGNGCDSNGTPLGSGSNPVFYNIDGMNIPKIGDDNYDIFADGNCSTYTVGTGTSYYQYGTFLVQIQIFDPPIGWVYLNWFSDGTGGVYATF